MIEIRPYKLRLVTPYRWSKGTQHHRAGLILRAHLGGAVGWGEAALPPHVDYEPGALARECASIVSGLDAAADEFLDELSLRECPPRLRCGLATAVLSARAAARGVSLARFLAGADAPLPARVPVNDLIGDADPAACVRRAEAALAAGQDTVKVKCTTERELDLARVRALRAAFPGLAIRIDPNESWPLAWAADQLEAMAPCRIEYCEEPLPRGTPLAEYGRLRRRTGVPIALDDSIRGVRDVELAVLLEAADVLVLKAQRLGGPDHLLEVVRAATQAGLRSTVTSSLETSVGLTLGIACAALTPEPVAPAGIGTARYFAENVCTPPPIVDGHMAVPDAPGLGCDPQAWWDAQ